MPFGLARIATFPASFTELEVTKKIRRLIKNRDQPPLNSWDLDSSRAVIYRGDLYSGAAVKVTVNRLLMNIFMIFLL